MGDLGVESNSVLIVDVVFRESGRRASTRAKSDITKVTKAIESWECHEYYMKCKAEETKKQKNLENDKKPAANKREKMREVKKEKRQD